MSHIHNQTQDLYNLELVQDLNQEAAASVSGGALYLSSAYSAGGDVDKLTAADPDLDAPGGADGLNNKVSWYQVTGNRSWYAYTGKYYTGTRYLLKAGTKGNLYGYANNTFSSVKPA